MSLPNAAFSAHLATLLAQEPLVIAFPVQRRRQVNVLREDNFPLLAAWVEADSEADDRGSDGELAYETECTLLAAARLGQGDAQDQVLGQLIKVVKDVADNMGIAGVEYSLGRWDADNNAAEGEGDRVWAAFPLIIRHRRPRGNY